MKKMHEFLIRFAQSWLDFRLLELESISATLDVPLLYDDRTLSQVKQGNSPFLLVRTTSLAAIKQVISRAILIKDGFVVLAKATSVNGLVDAMKEYIQDITHPDPFDLYRHASFKYVVNGFLKKHTPEERQAIIRAFSFIPFEGVIDMRKPDIVLTILTNEEDWYFGVLASESSRHLVDIYDLKKRSYIGITSMNAELSLVMSNIAKLGRGKLVYDPFVGTGSFLVTSAAFGSYGMGSDIDGRQIRGCGRSEGISKNAVQYQLSSFMLDTVVFDVTCHPWTDRIRFDAIITDPPYGIRAGAKRISSGERAQSPDPM